MARLCVRLITRLAHQERHTNVESSLKDGATALHAQLRKTSEARDNVKCANRSGMLLACPPDTFTTPHSTGGSLV